MGVDVGKGKKSKQTGAMSLIHPNAAAIDIGATMHMAAVAPDCDPEPVRSFGTFTGDLHRLADWFAACGVKAVVMESTGVYWVAIYEILDARGFDVMVVNARNAKHVPGRKTDVSDAQWLQRLHSYGLLRGSFHPQGEIAVLRAYLRQRERLLDYSASHIQHMQKALIQMNLQIHHVVSDITGATGMRIIRAIVAGERDAGTLAAMRDKRCHADEATIAAALTGTATARKIAVLFYNTLRHGMDYADPGAAYYEERYRQRVVANLQRRAKAFGFILEKAVGPDPVCVS